MRKRACEKGASCPYQARCDVPSRSTAVSVVAQDPHKHMQHLMEFSHGETKKQPKKQKFEGTAHTLNGKPSSKSSGYRLGGGGADGGAGAAAGVSSHDRTSGGKRSRAPTKPRDAKKAAAQAALARHGGAGGGAAAPAAEVPKKREAGAKRQRSEQRAHDDVIELD